MPIIMKENPEDFIVDEVPLSWIINERTKGPYTYFKLTKRDLTTSEAIRRVAKRLNRSPKLFGYAGMKDRRAITTQYCSVRGPLRDYDDDALKVECVGHGTEPISLGSLLGNRFTIYVRGEAGNPRNLSLVPNYFDSQRFGSSGNNADIGKAIVERDFVKAARMAASQKSVHAEMARTHLEEHPQDGIGALRFFPKRTLLLFVHAFQALLYNKILDRFVRATSEKCGEIELRPMGNVAVPLEKIDTNLGLPLVGFGTDTDAYPMEIQQSIQELLGQLTSRSFLIRQFPELSSEGRDREAFVWPKDLKTQMSDSGVWKLEFTLPPGSYATIVTKALFSQSRD